MVEESAADQGLSRKLGEPECALHKDASLTFGESAATPPRLDDRAALFLDVDGTLLEIAPRPELVRVPHGLVRLITRTAEKRGQAFAVISGRPLAELDELFEPWHGAAAGLHGVERRRADGTFDRNLDAVSASALDHIRPNLASLAAHDTRLMLEDKGGTVALHYRAAPEREAEILACGEQLRRESAWLRLIAGKMVIEFQPANVNKGSAIAAFMNEPPFAGRLPVFVGDDTTDEDGFAEVARRGGIGICVGPRRDTAATYRLPSVSAVLAWLAKARCSMP